MTTPRLLAASLALLATAGMTASTALADGSQTITPGPTQKAAIIKAFAKPSKPGPAKCYTVKISKNAKWLSGVTFNTRGGSTCRTVAFDGAAVLYGNGNNWYALEAASSMAGAQCTALKLLMGANGWQDLAGFAGRMGCQNVD
jgi:hypothetical protein